MAVSVLSMDEFEIIKNYFKKESFRSDVLLGIGDDGAAGTRAHAHATCTDAEVGGEHPSRLPRRPRPRACTHI